MPPPPSNPHNSPGPYHSPHPPYRAVLFLRARAQSKSELTLVSFSLSPFRDTVAEAFTYTPGFRKTTFTATADTHVYADETTFQSDGTTYYRVVKAQQ